LATSYLGLLLAADEEPSDSSSWRQKKIRDQGTAISLLASMGVRFRVGQEGVPRNFKRVTLATRILNHMVKYYRLAFVYASNYFQYCEPSISTHFAIQFIIS
jgi:hypothetical protein